MCSEQIALINQEGLFWWGWNGIHITQRIPQLILQKCVVEVALGDCHGICLVSGESVIGSLTPYSWGLNDCGQLGLIDTFNRESPSKIQTLKNKQIKKVYAGSRCSFAISGM